MDAEEERVLNADELILPVSPDRDVGIENLDELALRPIRITIGVCALLPGDLSPVLIARAEDVVVEAAEAVDAVGVGVEV